MVNIVFFIFIIGGIFEVIISTKAFYLVVTALFVMKYASVVKKDPEKSIIRDIEIEDKTNSLDLNNIPKSTPSHIRVLLTFVAGMGIMMFGVFRFGWYITELSAVFLGIGLARGILVVMQRRHGN